MDQFEKKQANREKRQESKQVIKKWDAEPKGKKKGGLKACPGFVDHTGRKKVELTVPCPTCKRHFCSQECLESHEEICKAKNHFNETKDLTQILRVSHAIFDKYYDEHGCALPKWVKEHDLGRNAGLMHGMWTLRWKHPELGEACRLLKKHDPEFHARLQKESNLRFYW